MFRLLLLVYNILFFPLAFLLANFISLFNTKIRRGLTGRKNTFQYIKKALPKFDNNQPKVLFHVSSYGEFLQARPVLQHLKKINPRLCLIVTVFSPSGYDNIKLEPPIDIICYLPIDGFFQMKRFISLISPQVVVIIRHDIWPNFVWRIWKENIPLLLIDASLPNKSTYTFPVLKTLTRTLYRQMTKILTISENETEKFRELTGEVEKIVNVGDTKYDQVFERSKLSNNFKEISGHPIFKNKNIFVCGSSWEEDEAFIIPAFQNITRKVENAFLIIAPHEPYKKRIEEIKKTCRENGLRCVCLSALASENDSVQCLIIDQIGLLANIYSFAKVAFVGGSFYTKIHNVLEPAIYGVPILFGPKMNNSMEAENLLAHEAAIKVGSIKQISDLSVRLFLEPEFAAKYGNRAKEIVMKNVGSSEKIARMLFEKYLSKS